MRTDATIAPPGAAVAVLSSPESFYVREGRLMRLAGSSSVPVDGTPEVLCDGVAELRAVAVEFDGDVVETCPGSKSDVVTAEITIRITASEAAAARVPRPDAGENAMFAGVIGMWAQALRYNRSDVDEVNQVQATYTGTTAGSTSGTSDGSGTGNTTNLGLSLGSPNAGFSPSADAGEAGSRRRASKRGGRTTAGGYVLELPPPYGELLARRAAEATALAGGSRGAARVEAR